MDEDEREDVHDDEAHLVAQVGLDEDLMLQRVLMKRVGLG